jgi:hypothetical protein
VPINTVRPVLDDRVIDGLKFLACLPTEMALEMLGERLAYVSGARQVLEQRVRFIGSADQDRGSETARNRQSDVRL